MISLAAQFLFRTLGTMMVSRVKWQGALAVLLMAVVGVWSVEDATRAATATNAAPIELRGKVIQGKDRSVAFRTDSGAAYNLMFTRMSAALFTDTNFQSKTLVLKGRVLPDSNLFEVTGNLRSVRDGKLHELFYYCDICAIKGIDPGECMCCRDPVRLIEEPVSDAGSGRIAGRVLFRGSVPRAGVADENGAHRPLLEVDGKTRGLKDVVAYLETTPALRSASPPMDMTSTAVVDQQNHTFVPHLLAVRSGQEMRFTNSDPANHNVRASSPVRSNEFNVFTGAGGSYKRRFVSGSNATPVQLGCDIHPWMRAWVFALDHPFFAISGTSGNFEIGEVPTGAHTLVLRQPDVGYESSHAINVKAGESSRVEIEITEGELKR